jgi:hypothetical protein
MSDCGFFLALVLVALIVVLLLRAKPGVFALFTGSDTLASGASMTAGDSIKSANGKYTLSVDTTRRVILRDHNGRRRWASREVGGTGGLKLTLTKDGHLELTGGRGSKLWAPTEQDNPGATLKVSNDGKIKLLTRNGAVIWSAP